MDIELISFKGTLGRPEYVAALVVNVLLVVVVCALLVALQRWVTGTNESGRDVFQAVLTYLALLEISLASFGAQARRLRDIGVSPWHLVWLASAAGAVFYVSVSAYSFAVMLIGSIYVFVPSRFVSGGGIVGFPSAIAKKIRLRKSRARL